MQLHLSYLMGAESIHDEELKNLGIEITGRSEAGSRMLKVPEASLSQYVELVKEKLSNGFWNEVVGTEKILFIFKFEDGHVEEITLSPETEPRIDKLCAEFNNEPPEETANVYKYLSENDFYHNFMTAHYQALINR